MGPSDNNINANSCIYILGAMQIFSEFAHISSCTDFTLNCLTH
ncbi:hypothetical protein HanXRQr2_Chr13g0615961 [Helianthus annuus]|uniref:Uncharacterized protein n=1 Tax=Helianthus annuus TaxID=4232 RepID=A0A9K3EM05_HELAN|nr:hypothetical protein HanXRQr2_Chr13g0615961 [Helianthus annuus]